MNKPKRPPMDHKVRRPFEYVPAAATNIQKTFDRLHREQKEKRVAVVEFRARAR